MGRPHPNSYYEPGKRYNKLVVLYEQPKEKRKDPGRREIVCKCDCGKIVSLVASRVFYGTTKSCGCNWINALRKHDVIGKRFGRLVAIKELDPRKNSRRILCKCDCGNETVVNISYLLHGNTKSCGCLHVEKLKELNDKSIEDITGKVFGELTAIKKVDSYIGRTGWSSTRWLFKCSCGKEVILHKSNVKKGMIINCGHIGRRSNAEFNISKWLNENNINHEKEASFSDLRNPESGHKLFFDYKIYRNDGSFFLVEHQGVQHFYSDEKEFGKQQREQTDQIKKAYCEEKGITLYETLYNEDYIAKLQEIISKELGQDGDVCEKEVMTG